MLTHRQIWTAVDALAARYSLTPSGLAKRAGLDPTTFNKSKRQGADGRKRWPNTESLSKILDATGASLDEFLALIQEAGQASMSNRSVPLLGFAEAGTGGYFDDGGFPVGGGWDDVKFPESRDNNMYALEISGDSMMPLYRNGDVIIVSPNSETRRGDRVVLKTVEGEVMATILHKRSEQAIELHSLNPDHDNLVFQMSDIAWIARILWASQ
jgi:phage repressor protein C with HTH and peptisase S24 domain